MAAMTKQAWVEWRTHPVTQVVFDEIAEAVSSIMHQVLTRLDDDKGLDRYQKGYLAGVKAVMDFEPELIEEKPDAEDQGRGAQGYY